MTQIIFMRHGFLEGKYQDYSKLSFEELQDLLTKKALPNIDNKKTNLVLKEKNIQNIDIIFCSEEPRAIDTAKIASKILKAKYEKTQLLDEINFQKRIINKEDVELGFNHIRKKVITQFFHSNYSEKFEDIKRRFLNILEEIKKSNYNKVLCITHGWFMRLIYVYSAKKSLENISLDDLLNSHVPNFLESITIDY